MSEVRFRVTAEERASLEAYVAKKRRWKHVSDFARYCVFREMEVNRYGAHHRGRGEAPAPRSGGNPEGRPA
jgi:hypothetical protein